MLKKDSKFTQKIIIWTAPAWTPIIFLYGITIIADSFIYGAFSSMFIAAHIYHEIIRYRIIFMSPNKNK
jgi:hypothetical protein